jgi:hypothetical protein
MTSYDFAAVVGGGFSLTQHFNLGIRYNHGLSDIYDPEPTYFNTVPNRIQNRILIFYLAYSF